MKIKCKFCGSELSVPDTADGRMVRCKHCGKTFVARKPEQKIAVSCPHCGTGVQVSQNLMGKFVLCTKCQKNFVAGNAPLLEARVRLAKEQASGKTKRASRPHAYSWWFDLALPGFVLSIFLIPVAGFLAFGLFYMTRNVIVSLIAFFVYLWPGKMVRETRRVCLTLVDMDKVEEATRRAKKFRKFAWAAAVVLGFCEIIVSVILWLS